MSFDGGYLCLLTYHSPCEICKPPQQLGSSMPPASGRRWPMRDPAPSPPPQPVALPVSPGAIPDALKALPQWVCWRYELKHTPKPGYTKVPYSAETGRRASATYAAAWDTFEAALACYQQNLRTLDGIGFVVTEATGLVGVDLDHCVDAGSGAIQDWALAIVRRLATYGEVSPSGTGLR